MAGLGQTPAVSGRVRQRFATRAAPPAGRSPAPRRSVRAGSGPASCSEASNSPRSSGSAIGQGQRLAQLQRRARRAMAHDDRRTRSREPNGTRRRWPTAIAPASHAGGRQVVEQPRQRHRQGHAQHGSRGRHRGSLAGRRQWTTELQAKAERFHTKVLQVPVPAGKACLSTLHVDKSVNGLRISSARGPLHGPSHRAGEKTTIRVIPLRISHLLVKHGCHVCGNGVKPRRMTIS